jgi:nucleoside 2-deoxyribosyltransferase
MATEFVHIVMPVGSDPGFRLKQAAIRRGVEAAGYQAHFPDYHVANPTFDAEHFADQLRSASAVLADLTGERPSCYFEIGFAEALDRPIFLVAERGTNIHQSAFRHAIRHYANLPELELVVSDLLSEAAHGGSRDSRPAKSAM